MLRRQGKKGPRNERQFDGEQAQICRPIGRARERKHTKRKKRGKRVSVAWSLTRPGAGVFISDKVGTTPVLYERKCGLKEKVEKRNSMCCQRQTARHHNR